MHDRLGWLYFMYAVYDCGGAEYVVLYFIIIGKVSFEIYLFSFHRNIRTWFFFRGILNELINCVVLSEMFILLHDIRDNVGEHRAGGFSFFMFFQ